MATSEIDAATGLLSRGSFRAHLDEQLAVAQQTGTPLVLLALDVDHLAYVNYYYNPPAGDAALGMVATVLRAQLRHGLLARFGADEFYALLPNVTLDDALMLAERVRRAAVTIELDDPDLWVPSRCLSFSLTVVAYPEDGNDASALLALVERGLREAKIEGRDTVYRFP